MKATIRTTYSVLCQACRFSTLHVQTLDLAREIAVQHSNRGHVVTIQRETIETVATVGP